MKKVVMMLIRGYQLTLSALIGRQCRFYPSCSQYTLEAVDQHGVVKGVRLGIVRISKCHPFHPGGHDPVPDAVEQGMSKGQ